MRWRSHRYRNALVRCNARYAAKRPERTPRWRPNLDPVRRSGAAPTRAGAWRTAERLNRDLRALKSAAVTVQYRVPGAGPGAPARAHSARHEERPQREPLA